MPKRRSQVTGGDILIAMANDAEKSGRVPLVYPSAFSQMLYDCFDIPAVATPKGKEIAQRPLRPLEATPALVVGAALEYTWKSRDHQVFTEVAGIGLSMAVKFREYFEQRGAFDLRDDT